MRSHTPIMIAALMIMAMLYLPLLADESMNLVATIRLPDTLKIDTSLPVGDFNADGYEDFLVTAYRTVHPSYYYETALIYYGGPQFDIFPDLIFRGQANPSPGATGYGKVATGLGDFNGDGYDDLAIGAPFYNYDIGKIYVYFGGPDPDTTADLEIWGRDIYDELPYFGMMINGDYNGDGLGDLLAVANNVVMGPKVFIYLGGNPPDTVPDMVYDYTGRMVEIGDAYGGSDINGDGYDDYAWMYWEDGYHCQIFEGDSSLHILPAFFTDDYSILFINCDVSGDGIDDFYRGFYICLGGQPLDIEPDYYMDHVSANMFDYEVVGLGRKLITDEGGLSNRLRMYNVGVPFDTIPVATFNYGQQHLSCQPNIGDINADGIDEIALPFNDTLNGPYVNIYQISHTGINDTTATELPDAYGIITCYPNPFNSSVIITCNLPLKESDNSTLEIYDILGKLVKRFDLGNRKSSSIRVLWDGTTDNGDQIKSGIYFVKAGSPEAFGTTKLIYLK